MKKLFLVLILSVMLIALASTTYATCSPTSVVLKTLNYTTTGVTVWVGAAGAATYYYTFTTTNANYMHILSGLLGKRVGIVGSATSCPTTGATRFGGTILNINAWD